MATKPSYAWKRFGAGQDRDHPQEQGLAISGRVPAVPVVVQTGGEKRRATGSIPRSISRTHRPISVRPISTKRWLSPSANASAEDLRLLYVALTRARVENLSGLGRCWRRAQQGSPKHSALAYLLHSQAKARRPDPGTADGFPDGMDIDADLDDPGAAAPAIEVVPLPEILRTCPRGLGKPAARSLRCPLYPRPWHFMAINSFTGLTRDVHQAGFDRARAQPAEIRFWISRGQPYRHDVARNYSNTWTSRQTLRPGSKPVCATGDRLRHVTTDRATGSYRLAGYTGRRHRSTPAACACGKSPNVPG